MSKAKSTIYVILGLAVIGGIGNIFDKKDSNVPVSTKQSGEAKGVSVSNSSSNSKSSSLDKVVEDSKLSIEDKAKEDSRQDEIVKQAREKAEEDSRQAEAKAKAEEDSRDVEENAKAASISAQQQAEIDSRAVEQAAQQQTDQQTQVAQVEPQTQSPVPITKEVQPVDNTNQGLSPDTPVWYTPKGKSYHLNPNCSTLSQSKNVIPGTLGTCGKTDPCNVCAGGQ